MSWIKEFNITDAKGLLQKEYNAALNRSGRIWNIVKCMSTVSYTHLTLPTTHCV